MNSITEIVSCLKMPISTTYEFIIYKLPFKENVGLQLRTDRASLFFFWKIALIIVKRYNVFNEVL